MAGRPGGARPTRPSLLLARARGIPGVAAGVLVTAATVSLASTPKVWDWLPAIGRPAPVVVALFASFVAATLAVRCLGSASEELEASTPRLTRRWRAAFLGAVTTGAVVPLVLAALWTDRPGLPEAVLVTAVGLIGLSVATASVVGVRRSWSLPLTYVALVYVLGQVPTTSNLWDHGLWAWPVVPNTWHQDSALAGAALITVLGVLLHLVRRPPFDREVDAG
ncbi:MAG: hypothetical protein ACRC35_09090 [Angustibacter sp.]